MGHGIFSSRELTLRTRGEPSARYRAVGRRHRRQARCRLAARKEGGDYHPRARRDSGRAVLPATAAESPQLDATYSTAHRRRYRCRRGAEASWFRSFRWPDFEIVVATPRSRLGAARPRQSGAPEPRR